MKPITVVELPEFQRRAHNLFSDEERDALIAYLALHPKEGDVMVGTGGIRKLRWAYGNRGKSSGGRVIYYFHDHRIPLFLFTVFPKNLKANLTEAERSALSKAVSILLSHYLEQH